MVKSAVTGGKLMPAIATTDPLLKTDPRLKWREFRLRTNEREKSQTHPANRMEY